MRTARLLLDSAVSLTPGLLSSASAGGSRGGNLWSRLRQLSSLSELSPAASSSPSSAAAPQQPSCRSFATATLQKQRSPAALAFAELISNQKEKPPPRDVPLLEPRPYTARSRRCGVIAIKAGMTQDWNEWGVRVPLTVLWVDDCQVVQVKTREHDGTTALQLGCGIKRAKSLHPRQLGHFRAAGDLPLKRKLAEFPVTEDALLPVGTQLTAGHYVAGQHVDVTGVTKGKGFQGVMKRWGFKGMPASHGVSLAHRAPGATGCRNDPGRVWKGKKLPGRMGNHRRTVHSCFVFKVDPERNLVYVRGQVPGQVGNFVLLRDAMRKSPASREALPFPTVCGEQLSGVQVAAVPVDPFRVYQQDIGYFSERWKGGD